MHNKNNRFYQELQDLKEYCYKYIQTTYGTNQNYIKKTRITPNGLFVYGHKVYALGYGITYTIYTFINWYDSNDYQHIQNLLDHFVLDCQRLREV